MSRSRHRATVPVRSRSGDAGRPPPPAPASSAPTTGRRPGGLLPLLLAATVALSGCALPRWPAEAPVTSAFGMRWRGLLPEVHRGVDLAVPSGTPVRAMAGGRVRFAGTMRGFGQVVWLDHGGEVLTVYAHLSRLQVRTGDPVGGGQVVGLSGSSGDVTAPHLHFEVWRWGRPVDPVPLLGGRPES